MYQTALGFYLLMMRPLVTIPDCTRVLPSNYEAFSEHVPDCTRDLPSNYEAFSEHIFDSVECCIINKLIPGNCVGFVT